MSDPERPHEPDPRIVDLAMHVADGAPVDWDSAKAGASDLADSLERLREIQAVAAAYRGGRDASGQERRSPVFRWGDLDVLEKLGEGGYAEVWLARDPSLDREVALKLRRAQTSGAAGWIKEAQRLARVRHPNVLQVYGADVHDGRPGLWTELVQGRTLEQRLVAEGPCSAAEAAVIGLQLCAALAAVHGAGLFHGDLSTRNVMREGAPAGPGGAAGAGRIVLMDFGTASESAGDPRKTSAGTPLFAAPELLAGGPAAAAGDFYALGVVLFRLVTGEFPVHAASLEELRDKLARGEARSLRDLRSDLPPAFTHVVERLLEHDPAKRWRTAAEAERALAAILGPAADPGTARTTRRSRLLSGILGAGALGLVLAGIHWIPEWTRPRFHLGSGAPPEAIRMVQAISDTTLLGLFGVSTVCPGDLDGDGLGDLLVGAPDEEKSAGHVYVYRGLPDGTFDPWYVLSASLDGEFGGVVAALGDIDGDGRPEYAVSALIESAAGAGSGALYVYRAADGPGAPPAARIPGQLVREKFGYSVAGVGDVNGDGFGDFVVGAPGNGAGAPGAGCAYVFLGGRAIPTVPDIRLRCNVPLSEFGHAVAGLGDVNGDGFPDYGVGAYFDPTRGTGAGRVAVFYGGRVLRSDADFNLYGRDTDCWFGTALCGMGDVNEDGFSDFAVGAERDRGFAYRSGCIHVYLGGPQPQTEPAFSMRGEERYAALGRSLAGGGDLDGDGHPDLAAGESNLSAVRSVGGGVLVFPGGPRLNSLADTRLLGDEEEGNFGWALAALPPCGDRGFSGLVVGSPYAHPGGSIHVYRFDRYAFARPGPGERWTTGVPATASWLGAAPADLEWAPADGGPWKPLAHAVGGHSSNSVEVTLPAEAEGSIRLRLRPSDSRFPGESASEVITVASSR